MLRSFGVDVEAEDGTVAVRGPARLSGAEIQCGGDRDITLMAATAALLADSPSVLHGPGLLPEHFPSPG